jgi:hypothetical protein
MELSRLLEELTAAARKVGITVRSEPFDPSLSDSKRWRGGMCIVRGRPVILIDSNAPLTDRIAMLAAALATVDLDHVFLPPIVRATIGAYQREAVGPKASADPLPPVRARWRPDEGDK